MQKGQTPIVVDASVALKWFIPDERGAEQAADILQKFSAGDFALLAPDLFPYEVANGLIMSHRRGRVSEDAVLLAIRQFTALRIPRFPVDSEHAARIAFKVNLSLYDAAYLDLALRLRTSLITADRSLHEKGKRLLPRLVWLEDL